MGRKQQGLLYRYTILASAIDTLTHHRLILRSANNWRDGNDTALISLYRKRTAAEAVRLLCLTQAPETSHHWSSFAPGSDGVRIEFDRDQLLPALERQGIICREVQYPEINRFIPSNYKVEDIPFLKRYPYRGEEEVRLVLTSRTDKNPDTAIAIPADCIVGIVLGPSLPDGLVPGIKEMVRRIPGWERIAVHKTTLELNQGWLKLVERI